MDYLLVFSLPFTTRMTVIRLPDGGLWLHSPTPLDDGLRAAIDALGPVAHIVAYLSCFLTLMPGDVILTGTPPGVGLGMKPPRFLNPGDEVRLGIAGLGEQHQRIIAWPG